jgi:hypothetical protein
MTTDAKTYNYLPQRLWDGSRFIKKENMMFDIEKRRKELAGIRYENFGGHFIYSAVDDIITQEKFMIEPLINCLKLYYDHCKNDHQINGINETAKKLLGEYNV